MGTVEGGVVPPRLGDGEVEEATEPATPKSAPKTPPGKPTAKAAPVVESTDEELEDAISFDEQGETPADESSTEGETEGDKETPAAFESPALPEGVELDAELLGKLGPWLARAKEHGLDQEWFQGLVDDYTAHVQVQAETAQSVVETQYKAQQREWVDQVRQDAEWGGPRYAATRKLASVGFERLFGREAARAFQLTGLLNHPDVVIGCAKAGKLFSERPVVLGGSTNQQEELSDEEVLFGGRK